MPAYPFPDELPIEQIRAIRKALLGGGIDTGLLNPAWVVAGYGMGMVAPDDSSGPNYGLAHEATPALTDDQLIAYLDRLELRAESGDHVVMGIGSTIARAIAKKLLRLALEAL